MTVGFLSMQLAFPNARTIKDRRNVMRGIRDRIRSRFNASVCITTPADNIQNADAGIAVVSVDSRGAMSTLDSIIQVVRDTESVIIVSMSREVL